MKNYNPNSDHQQQQKHAGRTTLPSSHHSDQHSHFHNTQSNQQHPNHSYINYPPSPPTQTYSNHPPISYDQNQSNAYTQPSSNPYSHPHQVPVPPLPPRIPRHRTQQQLQQLQHPHHLPDLNTRGTPTPPHHDENLCPPIAPPTQSVIVPSPDLEKLRRLKSEIESGLHPVYKPIPLNHYNHHHPNPDPQRPIEHQPNHIHQDRPEIDSGNPIHNHVPSRIHETQSHPDHQPNSTNAILNHPHVENGQVGELRTNASAYQPNGAPLPPPPPPPPAHPRTDLEEGEHIALSRTRAPSVDSIRSHRARSLERERRDANHRSHWPRRRTRSPSSANGSINGGGRPAILPRGAPRRSSERNGRFPDIDDRRDRERERDRDRERWEGPDRRELDRRDLERRDLERREIDRRESERREIDRDRRDERWRGITSREHYGHPDHTRLRSERDQPRRSIDDRATESNGRTSDWRRASLRDQREEHDRRKLRLSIRSGTSPPPRSAPPLSTAREHQEQLRRDSRWPASPPPHDRDHRRPPSPSSHDRRIATSSTTISTRGAHEVPPAKDRIPKKERDVQVPASEEEYDLEAEQKRYEAEMARYQVELEIYERKMAERAAALAAQEDERRKRQTLDEELQKRMSINSLEVGPSVQSSTVDETIPVTQSRPMTTLVIDDGPMGDEVLEVETETAAAAAVLLGLGMMRPNKPACQVIDEILTASVQNPAPVVAPPAPASTTAVPATAPTTRAIDPVLQPDLSSISFKKMSKQRPATQDDTKASKTIKSRLHHSPPPPPSIAIRRTSPGLARKRRTHD